jgi:uncharacterized protein YndB with AHSA1/START domain
MATTRSSAAREAASPDATLTMRRTLPVPRAEAFRVWTLPEHQRHWLCPAGYQVVEAQVDLRIGGRYRIGMRAPNGDVSTTTGVYQVIEAPARIVYTWRWEAPDALETVVTVEFHDLGQETELVLRHDRFADSRRRDLHAQGWVACLANLDAYLATRAKPR